MGAYAWCYYTNEGREYWTEAFKMSATDFAIKVSGILHKDICSQDLAALNQKDVQRKKKYPDEKFIHVDRVFPI